MKWKTIAITSIIFNVFLIVIFSWLFSLGNQMIANETECQVNICGYDNYDNYYYDEYESVCYCMIDGEIEHQEFIK